MRPTVSKNYEGTDGRWRWDWQSVFAVSAEGDGLCHPPKKTPHSLSEYIFSWLSCCEAQVGSYHSNHEVRSSPTMPRLKSVDHADKQHQHVLQNHHKKATSALPASTPMHYDPCAFYWVLRCRCRAMVGRAHSVVAHRMSFFLGGETFGHLVCPSFVPDLRTELNVKWFSPLF